MAVKWLFLVALPSVLRRCWLFVRESIRPVKDCVIRCWHGYLSGARCEWFAYGPANATATPSSLSLLKSRMVWPFWWRLTQAVLENEVIRSVSCKASCMEDYFCTSCFVILLFNHWCTGYCPCVLCSYRHLFRQCLYQCHSTLDPHMLLLCTSCLASCYSSPSHIFVR